MPPRPTGWTRLVSRLRGEIPAEALEAYRRASLPVFELLEQVEKRRLEMRIDGVDPWSVPQSARAAFLCAWNAFVLQTLGNELLDADYRREPATHGYVPPVTAAQVSRFYEPVEGWVNRAYQAQANPAYALDAEVPARLPAWQPDPVPPAHLPGLLHALRAVLDHADAAVAALPETAPNAPRKRAQLQRIRQLHASARSRARYAEELAGVDPVPEVEARAAEHARDAVEQLFLLGQLVADPALADAKAPEPPPPPPPAPSVPRTRKALPAPSSAAAGRRRSRVDELLAVARDPAESMDARNAAILHASWGGAPVASLAVLYDALDDRELCQRVLFGLVARAEDEAVEMLARVAAEDDDEALRGSALFWLRNSRHPRAVELLARVHGLLPPANG